VSQFESLCPAFWTDLPYLNPLQGPDGKRYLSESPGSLASHTHDFGDEQCCDKCHFLKTAAERPAEWINSVARVGSGDHLHSANRRCFFLVA
jgi:hypothetical protein